MVNVNILFISSDVVMMCFIKNIITIIFSP